MEEVMEAQLCDEEGWVRGKYLNACNNLRAASINPDARTPVTKPFVCTGSHHVAGLQVVCTSPYHKARA